MTCDFLPSTTADFPIGRKLIFYMKCLKCEKLLKIPSLHFTQAHTRLGFFDSGSSSFYRPSTFTTFDLKTPTFGVDPQAFPLRFWKRCLPTIRAMDQYPSQQSTMSRNGTDEFCFRRALAAKQFVMLKANLRSWPGKGPWHKPLDIHIQPRRNA